MDQQEQAGRSKPQLTGTTRAAPRRQRGWVGMLAVLVALAIVAFLAKDALKRYGLMGRAPAVTQAATPGERARAAGAAGAEPLNPGSAPAAAGTAVERARGVEDMVRQQADERARRVDSQSTP